MSRMCRRSFIVSDGCCRGLPEPAFVGAREGRRNNTNATFKAMVKIAMATSSRLKETGSEAEGRAFFFILIDLLFIMLVDSLFVISLKSIGFVLHEQALSLPSCLTVAMVFVVFCRTSTYFGDLKKKEE